MHSSFWWDTCFKNFFIEGWDIDTTLSLTLVCVALAVLSVGFEWLKLVQARLRQKELSIRAKQISSICPTTEHDSLLTKNRLQTGPLHLTKIERFCIVAWDAFIWANMQTLSYFLMLVVMFFNGWMTIAIIFGSGIGYFVFGPGITKVNISNCDIIRNTFCTITCLEAGQEGQSTPALETSHSAASVSGSCHQTVVCVH